ncbi:hypothetical protein ACFU99_38770 [Streptomyces sp. NPDC057654]|uniref:hypothetical protein n=1 Tax=Streptomyces sp. NPDC057654 TaxID=3346196 RepID=UPI0036CF4F4F
MVTRRNVIQLGGLAVGAWALGTPMAQAGTRKPPPGDHVPAPELSPRIACAVPPNHDVEVIKTVYKVGSDLGVNDKVMLAGFEAGWVESHMNNLGCGDRDSVGVFQQRPSQGWGTREQCMNVAYASNSFFTRAIGVDRNNPGWSAGQVAQGVQRSAFPDRYDQSESKARALIEEAARLNHPQPPVTTVPGAWAYEWGNQQHAFGRAPDNTLSHWFWAPDSGVNLVTWGPQKLVGKPNGFVWHDQQHAFGRSPNNTLAHWWWTPQGGVAYADWAGECYSDPMTYVWGMYDQQHIFAKGANNSLFHWYWDPATQKVERVEWGRQGFTGNPSGFAWVDQQHVFARSPQNTLAHWWWTPQGGVAYADWGGQCFSDPVSYVFPPYNQQHIFGRAADDTLFHWFWDPGTQRVETVSWGPQKFVGNPHGFVWHDQQHVFARTPQNTLAHWWWTPQGGVAYADWGGECHADPASYTFTPYDQQHIFSKAADGELSHWYWDPGTQKVETVLWGGQLA